jgi:pimeloyl-ACP methyl ester carboxylesterase
LLFDVAALLITSAALGPAAEASVAPASVSIGLPAVPPGVTVPGVGTTLSSIPVLALPVVTGPVLPASVPASNIGSGILVDPASVNSGQGVSSVNLTNPTPALVRTLSGISLVRELAALSSVQIHDVIASDPQLVTKLLQSPPAAREVTTLWTSLSASTRAKLVVAAPRLVGGLDGFPAAVRNTANRAWVSQSIAELSKKMPTVDGRAVAESDQHELHMLTEIESALKPTKHGPARSLLSADPTGQGKAVVVLGNLQSADYVTYLVPGMFYTVDGQLTAWTGDAADLYKQQTAWLKRLSANDPADAHKTVAVVAWMGYQTPDLTNIGSLDLANQARAALTSSVEALQYLRAGHEPYTTIVAHSYGSTAALMALSEKSFSVDALVLVGTPGSAAQSAKDLDVTGTNVWVGSAAWDPVPTSAFFGSDPSAPSYGAHTLGVGGGTDVITGKKLVQSIGHNSYFDPGTESIRNMAVIGIGHPELVMQGTASDSKRTLASAK